MLSTNINLAELLCLYELSQQHDSPSTVLLLSESVDLDILINVYLCDWFVEEEWMKGE
jgi:hypothetical protein